MPQFETLAYQEQAISAVVELFAGQPAAPGPNEIRDTRHTGLCAGPEGIGLGNERLVTDDAIRANLQEIQRRNGVAVSTTVPDGLWQFSVEMETGTGKTYVYLRTIFTLAQRYGWRKFIIVVPTVAIRQGVNSELQRMRDHLRERYEAMPVHNWIYSAAELKRTRDFAESTHLQIMVLNIDAFLRDNTVMRADKETLRGRTGIEYLQIAHPVVILDEPQRLDGDKAQKAIRDLNPLAILRYSATHRNPHNLIYRLGPAAAYAQNLVKRIKVWGMEEEADYNRPYVKLVSVIPAKRGGHMAKLEVHKQGVSGALVAEIKVKRGDDLADKADREMYQGYIVDDIECEPAKITFSNNVRLYEGQRVGDNRDALQKEMIKQTIRIHFDKEDEMRRQPEQLRCKVLTLFFIDKVANYWPAEGKFRLWFTELYEYYRNLELYKPLGMPPVADVHNGYFATVKSGKKDAKVEVAKDTEGDSDDDNSAYELIMNKKDELLRDDVPLRFIFSHTALAEGWDNPNIFQLCSLRDIGTETRRRQQIGRGLRIPVCASGKRSALTTLNVLTVIASESYGKYVNRLQDQTREETGESMPAPEDGRKRGERKIEKSQLQSAYFAALWQQIRQRTRYKLAVRTDELVARCTADFRNEGDVRAPKIRMEGAGLKVNENGDLEITTTTGSKSAEIESNEPVPIPDVLSYLHHQFPQLTRKTLARILVGSNKLHNLTINPQAFLDRVVVIIRRKLAQMIVEGIEYEKLPADVWWDQTLFEDAGGGFASRLVATPRHGLYDSVEVDSNIEREIAAALDLREDIKLFLKLPDWFKVPTPVGNYNPDWAVVKDNADGSKQVYLVRESKDTTDIAELDEPERAKVICGGKHFAAIGVDYKVVKHSSEI